MYRKPYRGKEPLPHDQRKQAHSPTNLIRTGGGRDNIDSIAIFDHNAAHHVAYDVPFDHKRDGRCVEVTITIEDRLPEVFRETTTHLSPAIIGHIAVTAWVTTFARTGRIVAAEIEKESVVTIRFDDGGYSDAETDRVLEAPGVIING